MDLIDTLKDLFRKKQQTAAAAYRATVRNVASGKKADAEATAKTLEDAGKTPDDFAADMAEYAERLKLQAVADTLPARQKEADALRAKVADIDRRFAEYVAVAEAEKAPLVAALIEADAALGRCRLAAQQLLGTMPEDHPRQAELLALKTERQSLLNRRPNLLDRIAAAEKRAAGLRINVRKGIPGYSEQVEAVEAEIDRLRSEVADIDAGAVAKGAEAERLYHAPGAA